MNEPTAALDSPLLLCLRNVSKRFPGVQALQAVNLDIARCEVHALVGENGAGKSTLMHILAGVTRPDEGLVSFGGEPLVSLQDQLSVQQQRIAIVFQERSLFRPMSIAENIFAGRQPTGFLGLVDRRSMYRNSQRLLDLVGLAGVDPETPVGQLSPHEQQLVEIAKALSHDAQLIIFDEPTAALTEAETNALFEIVRQLKHQQKKSIIYISHRLDEIFHIADRVTVLKDGKWQVTTRIKDVTPQELVRWMVGRELSQLRQENDAAEHERAAASYALEVRNLNDVVGATRQRVRLQNIHFAVRRGEIVALAGLAGAGRTETALALFGSRPSARGDIRIDGQPVFFGHARDAIRAGIGYLPEDRKEAGLFLEMSIAANMVAASLGSFGKLRLDDRRMNAIAEDYSRRLNISSRSIHQSVAHLSGGNQQKVLLAKWLLVKPKVLIVDEPTRGVDVGAKAEVHRLLMEFAHQGTAILLVSSELPEVLSLADRILVMAGGRITGELSRHDATEEKIVRLASRIDEPGRQLNALSAGNLPRLDTPAGDETERT